MSGGLLDDPDIVAALRHIGARERARPNPMCPRCGHRPQSTPDGWCIDCTSERHEREKAAKRRWWANHGPEWRAERNAAIKAGTLQPTDAGAPRRGRATPAPSSPTPARAGRAARARQASRG